MKNPYDSFKNSPGWNTINRAIDQLVRNNDIRENTHRDYIVGYLCKCLIEAGAISNSDLENDENRTGRSNA